MAFRQSKKIIFRLICATRTDFQPKIFLRTQWKFNLARRSAYCRLDLRSSTAVSRSRLVTQCRRFVCKSEIRIWPYECRKPGGSSASLGSCARTSQMYAGRFASSRVSAPAGENIMICLNISISSWKIIDITTVRDVTHMQRFLSRTKSH